MIGIAGQIRECSIEPPPSIFSWVVVNSTDLAIIHNNALKQRIFFKNTQKRKQTRAEMKQKCIFTEFDSSLLRNLTTETVTDNTGKKPTSSCKRGHIARLYEYIAGTYWYISGNGAPFWAKLPSHGCWLHIAVKCCSFMSIFTVLYMLLIDFMCFTIYFYYCTS